MSGGHSGMSPPWDSHTFEGQGMRLWGQAAFAGGHCPHHIGSQSRPQVLCQHHITARPRTTEYPRVEGTH